MAKNRKRAAKSRNESIVSLNDTGNSSSEPARKKKRVSWATKLEHFQGEEHEDADKMEVGENGDQVVNETIESDEEEGKPKKVEKIKEKKEYVKFDFTTAMERTVFVGNVPYTMKASALRKLFSPYGKIESIYKRSLLQKTEKLTKKMFGTDKELKTTVTDAHIYVRFEKAEDAEKSTELNGTLLKGRNLRVTLSSDKNIDATRSLFVGNLPYKLSEQSLFEFFKDNIGDVVELVRIIHDKSTGLGKGYGFVTFKDIEHIAKVLQKLQGARFKGRPIRLTKMIKKKKNRPLASPVDAKRNSKNAYQQKVLKHKLANYTVTKKTFATPTSEPRLNKKVVKSIKKRKQAKTNKRTLLN